jgi:hypothetical protein
LARLSSSGISIISGILGFTHRHNIDTWHLTQTNNVLVLLEPDKPLIYIDAIQHKQNFKYELVEAWKNLTSMRVPLVMTFSIDIFVIFTIVKSWFSGLQISGMWFEWTLECWITEVPFYFFLCLFPSKQCMHWFFALGFCMCMYLTNILSIRLIFIKASYICEELSLLANFAIYIISLKYLLLIDI